MLGRVHTLCILCVCTVCVRTYARAYACVRTSVCTIRTVCVLCVLCVRTVRTVCVRTERTCVRTCVRTRYFVVEPKFDNKRLNDRAVWIGQERGLKTSLWLNRSRAFLKSPNQHLISMCTKRSRPVLRSGQKLFKFPKFSLQIKFRCTKRSRPV